MQTSGKRVKVLSLAALSSSVQGGAGSNIRDITLTGTPPSFGDGPYAAATFGDLQAAQHLVRDPGIDTVTYATPPGPGTFVLGSYSQEDLSRDVRDGRFTINESVPRTALDQATARADDMFDQAVRTHESILERQDPNDEGYGFFDQQDRANRAYEDLQPLRDEYNAGRYVTETPQTTYDNGGATEQYTAPQQEQYSEPSYESEPSYDYE